jgi:hypothetical protein
LRLPGAMVKQLPPKRGEYPQRHRRRWCLHVGKAADRIELACDGDRPGVEVDVAPAEPARLADSQSGVGRNQRRSAGTFAHPQEQEFHLGRGQVARLNFVACCLVGRRGRGRGPRSMRRSCASTHVEVVRSGARPERRLRDTLSTASLADWRGEGITAGAAVSALWSGRTVASSARERARRARSARRSSLRPTDGDA